MPDRLISLLSSRTVLILAGNSVGTGSFIAPGRILTCAHVVRSANEKEERITVHYTISGNRSEETKETQVTGVYTSDRTENQEYPDIAILQIEETVHPLLRLPPSNEEFFYSTNHEYLAIGFQKRDRHAGRNIPQTVSLNYEGEEDAGHMRKIQFENGLVRPGMSGAPLVERESGKITGIVQKTRNPNDDIGAYTIPVEVIWGELKSGFPTLYNLLNSRDHRRQIQKEYRKAYPRYPMLRKYGIKLFILPLLLFFGLWWIFYHLGPIQESAVIATLLVILTFSGKLVSDWLGEEVSSESVRVKTKIGRILFSPVLLSLLGVVVVSFWFFGSSVWIYASPSDANLAVTLQANETEKVGRTKVFNTQGNVRFITAFFPFSDSIALKPEGREAKLIRLQTFFRKELFYPKDFLLEPVLVLRFDPNYFPFDALQQYVLHVQFESTGEEFTDSTLQSTGSILVGARQPFITEDKENEWHRDLEGLPADYANLIVDKWKEYEHHKEIDLEVGGRITVTLKRKSDGSVVNQQAYSLHDDETDKLFLIL